MALPLKPFSQAPLDPNVGSETAQWMHWVTSILNQVSGQANVPSGTGILSLINRLGLGIQRQILTANGVFFVPTSQVLAVIIGAGGGGGGGAAANQAGGGGGAGGCAIKWFTGLTINNTLTCAIGKGGAGGTGADGIIGGNTAITSGTQAIATITATGGGAGNAGNHNDGACGGVGTATGGDLNLQGGSGTAPGGLSNNVGGMGGNSIFGGGGRGSDLGTGIAGGAPGGGGGGGGGAANTVAGNGADGIIIFLWLG